MQTFIMFIVLSVLGVLAIFAFPNTFQTSNFILGSKVLIKEREYKRFIIFIILGIFFNAPNRFFMMIEDIIFPGLKVIEADFFTKPNTVVFVTGHARSGTTNIHKSLSSLEGVITGTFFDLIFPSLILKYLFSPLIAIVNKIFFNNLLNSDGVPNHQLGVNEEAEED